ncbi:5-oxoprolinase subunit B/C family protein [Microbacterium trichothecenolyticum]|uniref:KipI family sensor histidine kinase inhibitor n=1 Tax=Microbacterium trichothecenolyticum TaxID=69370 RepID=A0ABU0TUM7_MICTR|nr:urea amidolyase family protein [Microbacterium trichothecenolyticum]MDQ1123370.1 KipI family sensor histidine kinase inhibitor [Microbacterium trichothecenolyticum]
MVTPRPAVVGPRVTLLPMGDRAVLAEVADLSAVLALHAALADAPPAGIDDLVPAARTVLVGFDPRRVSASAVCDWILAAARSAPDAVTPGPLVEVPVRYDGVDLDSTAEMLGIPVATLVARHAGAAWTVAFTGFAPGFAYLVSDDWGLDVPRLPEPRTRVPAGAVGLAGEFSGAYPRETPGGWRLIGTTDAVLFDPDAESPVLLRPRSRVRFVAERERVEAAAADAAPTSSVAPSAARPAETAPGAPALRVLSAGGFTTVQDLGRPDRASLGVARSGALDRTALRIANRLIGNDEAAAGLEIALGGFRARAEADTWVCVSGALVDLRVAGRARDAYAAVLIPAGEELSIGSVRAGLRVYVSVRGGVVVPAAFGSRASDVLAGLGPARIGAGDLVSAGIAPFPIPVVDAFPWTVPPGLIDVRVAPGPRADWFHPAALSALIDAEWTVSPHADRVGIRLDGPELSRARDAELPSEGMRPGAIQVPPHGRPVVLLADGPVTGGYPVIGVVTDAALDALAQVRPGDRVRFRRA